MSLHPTGVPLYFGDEAESAFGCWHPATGTPRDLGVVICSAFGREELSSHRSLRTLATALAESGVPVLRFDYPGSGDAAGDASAPDRVATWVAAIGAAVDELKRLGGVGRVVLLGVRIGALLAVEAALRRDDVAGLAAIVPVTSGRAFVRELRLLGGSTESGPGIEAGGFVLAPQTCEALARLDALAHDRAPAAQMLIVDRDDMPLSGGWAERLRAQGVTLERSTAPGYADMMQDPERSRVAVEFNGRLQQWIAALPAPALPRDRAAHFPARVACRVPGGLERAVQIGVEGGRVSAVLALPAAMPAGAVGARAVILPNAGATRRVGPGRLHVELSRRLLARGWIVLRADLTGLGDSDAIDGAPDNVVYSASAVREVQALAAWLRDAWRVTDCRAIGLCSGAYHAFKAAGRGHVLDGVIPVNPLTFFWHPDRQPEIPGYKLADEMNRYRQEPVSAARLLKVLRGDVDLRRVGGVLAGALSARLRDRARDVARWVRWPIEDDLAAEVRALLARGVGLHFVFARGDPGIELLRRQGGAAVRRLERSGRIGPTFIEDADHTFTRAQRRDQLIGTLVDLLEAGEHRSARDARIGVAALSRS
jgi:pimeloyl-ACP methyl ester carboxylesterase